MRGMANAIGLTLLLIAVPLQAQTMTDAQKAEIEKAVKDQVTQRYAASDSLSAESVIQFWSRDKILGTLSPTGLNSDLESILKGVRSTFATLKVQKSELLGIKVFLISPEMAVAFTKGTGRFEYKNGNITSSNWANTSIWVKEAGGWKMIHSAGTAATRQ